MKEFIATVTSNGRVTIPMEVRMHLGVSDHSRLAFVIDNDGSVRMRSANSVDIESLRGVVGTLQRPLSWNEIREIAREDHLKEKLGARDE